MEHLRFNNGRFRTYPGALPREIKPFPGRFPTRWQVAIYWRVGKELKAFRYFGKPNFVIAAKVFQLLMSVKGDFWFHELDRAGTFQYARGRTPIGRVHVHDWDEFKVQFYYPWSMRNDIAMPWIMRPLLRSVALIYNKKRWVAYSPTQNVGADSLRRHAQWLQNTYQSTI